MIMVQVNLIAVNFWNGVPLYMYIWIYIVFMSKIFTGATAAQFGPSGPGNNVALSKPTWQSSTSVPSGIPGSSDKAVDGCLTNVPWEAGCSTHTVGDYWTWWSVDLGTYMNVFAVNMLGRGDCCEIWFTNFTIFGSIVSHLPSGAYDSQTCAYQSGQLGTTMKKFQCFAPIYVRYLIIQKYSADKYPMILCEVQVEACVDPNCEMCTSSSAFVCTECKAGYDLTNGECQTGSREASFIKTQYNNYLLDHPVQKVSTESVEECANWCISTLGCIYINYKSYAGPSVKNCHFLSPNFGEAMSKMPNKGVGWSVYEKKHTAEVTSG